MLNSLQKRKSENSNKGFTIIEVMIVLAIAGLILLIVFLAVPALQRNARNTQRKDDAAHIASSITEWQSNNGSATLTAGALTAALSSEKFSIIPAPSAVTPATTATTFTAAPDTAAVYGHAICNGNVAAYSPSARATVVVYGLEGNTLIGCVSAS